MAASPVAWCSEVQGNAIQDITCDADDENYTEGKNRNDDDDEGCGEGGSGGSGDGVGYDEISRSNVIGFM